MGETQIVTYTTTVSGNSYHEDNDIIEAAVNDVILHALVDKYVHSIVGWRFNTNKTEDNEIYHVIKVDLKVSEKDED
jgi:hypothetical protein